MSGTAETDLTPDNWKAIYWFVACMWLAIMVGGGASAAIAVQRYPVAGQVIAAALVFRVVWRVLNPFMKLILSRAFPPIRLP